MPRLVSESASWCSGFDTLVCAAGLQPIERHQQRAQVAGPRARRQHRHDVLVERRQADRVALAVHQVAERRREARAVLELRHPVVRAVAHRAADVEHQVAVEVGLLLELLDVVAIAARVDLPVDRRQMSSPGMYWRYSANSTLKPLNGLRCRPESKPFDDRPRLQLERAEARDDRGVEERPVVRGPRHGLHPALGQRHRSRSAGR